MCALRRLEDDIPKETRIYLDNITTLKLEYKLALTLSLGSTGKVLTNLF